MVYLASKIMLEGGELPYTDICVLHLFFLNRRSWMELLLFVKRVIKTPLEIELFRRSAAFCTPSICKIPDVYHPGMTDRELSVEVERLMRLEELSGIFRYLVRYGIFMGSVLAEIMHTPVAL